MFDLANKALRNCILRALLAQRVIQFFVLELLVAQVVYIKDFLFDVSPLLNLPTSLSDHHTTDVEPHEDEELAGIESPIAAGKIQDKVCLDKDECKAEHLCRQENCLNEQLVDAWLQIFFSCDKGAEIDVAKLE